LTKIDLRDTRITELPVKLGKCPLKEVLLGHYSCEKHDSLKRFKNLSPSEVAAKLRHEWNSTVSNFCQALFPVEDRDPEKPYDRLGDLPIEIKKHIWSFLS
jgi:hypothetical protein